MGVESDQTIVDPYSDVLSKVGDKWIRKSPCGHTIEYSSRASAKRAVDLKRQCIICIDYQSPGFRGRKHNQKTLDLISEKQKARKRTDKEREQSRVYLKSVTNTRPIYDIWIEKYGKEEADRRQENLREKRRVNSSGENNPMYGKPSPNGSGIGWKGWYDGRFFRSLRELSFMISNPQYVSAETKEWTAEYIDFKGTKRTTRPDFVCNSEKIVVECKPKRLHNSPSVSLKMKAMEKLCENVGYKYRLVDPEIISRDKILTLVTEGRVKFMGDYEKRVRDYGPSD